MAYPGPRGGEYMRPLMRQQVEIVYNDVTYGISCWTCCQIALKAAEDNFTDEVVTYNLEQMGVCTNIHHSRL